jgi:hypothetical protein
MLAFRMRVTAPPGQSAVTIIIISAHNPPIVRNQQPCVKMDDLRGCRSEANLNHVERGSGKLWKVRASQIPPI